LLKQLLLITNNFYAGKHYHVNGCRVRKGSENKTENQQIVFKAGLILR